MSDPLGLRLQYICKCMSDLSKSTLDVQNLLTICCHDYLKNKFEELNNATKKPKIHKKYEKEIEEKVADRNNNKEYQKENLINAVPIVPIPKIEENNKINEEQNKEEIRGFNDILDSSKELLNNIIENKSQGIKRSSPEITKIKEEENNINNKENPQNPKSKPKTQKKRKESIRKYNQYPKLPKVPRCKHQPTALFSTFTPDQQNRILYDKVASGQAHCSRKWGINHTTVIRFYRSNRDKFTTEKIEDWKAIMKESINTRLMVMNPGEVLFRVEGAVQKICNDRYSGLLDLCNLGFSKGIGVAAVRYRVDLFDLEFLLMNLCKRKWEQMERENWLNSGGDAVFKLDTIRKFRRDFLMETLAENNKDKEVNATTINGYPRYKPEHDLFESIKNSDQKEDTNAGGLLSQLFYI